MTFARLLVEVLERVAGASPQAVLARLGLLAEIEARSARVERLHGETAGGRVVMDMAYGDLAAGLHGLGVHRGVLFGALWSELGRAGVPVRRGTEVTGVDGGRILTAGGERLGPCDLVIAADGARSRLRFYSWASRLMTPVFQSHPGVLGPPRDRLLHPVARIPWMRRQFLARLAGAKTGVLGALDPSDYSA